jgi:hypothetical protein
MHASGERVLGSLQRKTPLLQVRDDQKGFPQSLRLHVFKASSCSSDATAGNPEQPMPDHQQVLFPASDFFSHAHMI